MSVRLGICVLVLSTILMGALIVGSPVAGNDSVAATTAGIDLGTPPRTTTMVAAEITAMASRPLSLLLIIVLLLGAAAIVLTLVEVRPLVPLLGWSTTARRGPPQPT